jgi:hypothetical protein
VSSTQTRARNHYRNQQKVALAGVRAVRQAVKAAPTPQAATVAATTTLATYQLASALNGARTMATEAGRELLSAPAAFVGTTQLGWPIETPIETIVDRMTRDLEDEIERLTDIMLAGLDLFVQSEIIAAGADAASVEITAGAEWTNYVRVLDLPSCDRCVILAGRIYRDLEGFARHPRCDCQHWPVTSWAEAEAAGLVTNPEDAFDRGQIGGYVTQPDGSQKFKPSLSAADTQAILDGADIQEIVNARRGGGRRPRGMTNAISAEIFGRTVKATTEGTTRRAEWRRKHPNLPIRLRPESIYEHAKDRDDALRLLRLYGYIK